MRPEDEINQVSVLAVCLLMLQVQGYIMACHVLTYFRADPALPRTSAMASFSVGIFREVIKPLRTFFNGLTVKFFTLVQILGREVITAL